MKVHFHASHIHCGVATHIHRGAAVHIHCGIVESVSIETTFQVGSQNRVSNSNFVYVCIALMSLACISCTSQCKQYLDKFDSTVKTVH